MNNSFFNCHRHLNIKKVAIAIIIAILLITCIIYFVVKMINHHKALVLENAKSNVVFYDANQNISIELSKKYHLKQYTPLQEHLIEVRSDNNLDIFISSKPKVENRNLQEIVSSDRRIFIEAFEHYSNLSELKELSVNENPAYTYSFHYLDSKLHTVFYIQIVWLEYHEQYYIFDIEFPLDDLSSYTNMITETLSSFHQY